MSVGGRDEKVLRSRRKTVATVPASDVWADRIGAENPHPVPPPAPDARCDSSDPTLLVPFPPTGGERF